VVIKKTFNFIERIMLFLFGKLGIPTKGLGFEYVKNTSWVTISKIIESLISYVIIVLISRELGAKGLGEYSFIFSFVGIFFIFADLGLSSLMIKDLSKDFSKVDKYISSVLITKLFLNIIVFLIFLGSLFFIQEKSIILMLIIVGFINAFGSFFSTTNSILQIKTKGVKIAIATLLERLLALVFGIYVLVFHKSLFLFIIVLLVSNFSKLIISWIFSKKYFKLTFEIDWKYIYNLLKKAFPFLLIMTFSVIYVRMDTIMLGFMKNYEVVGWYNAGYKLIDVLCVLPSLLLTFGFPMLSKFFVSDKGLAKKLFEEILFFSLIVVMPIILGVFFIGNRILEFIYNFNSVESFIAFKILIIALLFIYLTNIMGYLLASGDKQKIFAWIGGIGALVNIVLNFVLIPKYSLYGAGIATLITYFIMFVMMYVYIYKNFFKFKIKFFIPLIATIIMGLVLSQILWMHLFWIVGIGGGVYGVITFILVKFK
jgi:O-antigen/teichoic acid export membrane protein